MQAAPSGDRILIFCPLPLENRLIVIAYDPETGTETDRCTFDIESVCSCTVLDDTHFISGCKIYDLETGSSEYLEDLAEWARKELE